MSTLRTHATDAHPSQDQQEPSQPWIRLFLVMTVPVLLLLAGISLTR